MGVMDSNYRRKFKEDNFQHSNQFGGGSKPRSYNTRRPSSNNGWQPPSWEKKFCATVGRVPWQKVLETKKYMMQGDKVLEWKDSAVKEAFLNAKKRFYAEMHGQPCDIKLPDPDIFIDKIDWDSSNVDPDLLSDLDKRDPDIDCQTEENQDSIGGGVVFGIPVVPEQYLSTPTGWGDAEEEWAPQSGVRDWHNNGNVFDDGWGDDGYGNAAPNRASGGENRVRENRSTWNRNGYNKKQGDHGGWNGSRYKISRFNQCGNNGSGNWNNGNGNWNNGNGNWNGESLVNDYDGKRGNFAHERPPVKWRPVSKRW